MLLTKREIKKAGYWSSSCFRFHGSKKTIITTQKRTRRPISSHLDRTSWVNKWFISWPKRHVFLAGPRRKMSKGKMGTSFRLSREASQYTGFASYCRLADSAMLIILKIAWVPCCWGCIVCLFLSKQSRFLFAWSTFQHAVIVNWVEWLWNPSDSFVICFCGPESAQRSKEFLSFWLYWPIKTFH